MTYVASQKSVCDICNSCKLCELRKSYKKQQARLNLTTKNLKTIRTTNQSPSRIAYFPTLQNGNYEKPSNLQRCRQQKDILDTKTIKNEKYEFQNRLKHEIGPDSNITENLCLTLKHGLEKSSSLVRRKKINDEASKTENTPQLSPHYKNNNIKHFYTRHSMQIIDSTFASNNFAARRLEEEIRMTRSNINQRIEDTKKMCLIKSQQTGLQMKSLKSAIKLNQNKFMMEKNKEYDSSSLQSSCTDLFQKSVGKENETGNNVVQHKSERMFYCRQSKEERIGTSSNFNETIPNQQECFKLKITECQSRRNNLNKIPPNNNFIIHSPEPNRRSITYFKSNKYMNHPIAKAAEIEKKDVATYIAPIKYIEQKLKNGNPLSHLQERPKSLNQIKSYIINIRRYENDLKNYVAEKRIGKNMAKDVRMIDKGLFAKRIEKYKKEYCNMNQSIHDNIKIINKCAGKLQKMSYSKGEKNINEIIHNDCNNESCKCFNERPVERNHNFRAVKVQEEERNIKTKVENGIITLKSEVKLKQKEKDYQKPTTEQKPYEDFDTKETFMEKTYRLAQMFRENQKKMLKDSDAAKGTNSVICPEISVHTAYNVLPSCCEISGGGDVTQNGSSLAHPDTIDNQNDINFNIYNFEDSKKIMSIETLDSSTKEDTNKNYTHVVVSLTNNIEQFKTLQLQNVTKKCSSINHKSAKRPRKRSDCIKLKGVRKQKELTLKKSESDGEILRRRQIERSRLQRRQEKLNRKTLFMKALNEKICIENFSCEEITINNDQNIDENNKSFESDELQKCTEYFIQLLKSFRPELIQHVRQKLIAESKKSHETIHNLNQKSVSVELYKENINTRKYETQKIIQNIDEKIQRLDLSLKNKIVQTGREFVKQRSVQNVTNMTLETVKKTNDNLVNVQRGKIELNLDDVFANEKNWIKLDFQDELRIKKDISNLLSQNE